MSESPFSPDADVLPAATGANDGMAHAWPKISILDLMVWTLFSALFLALFDSDELEGAVKVAFDAQQVAYGIVAGAQLAALMAIVRWYYRSNRDGLAIRLDPGHWLLLTPVPWLATLVVGAIAGQSVHRIAVENWISWVYPVCAILSAIVWARAVARTKGGWRLLYWLLVAHAILQTVPRLLIAIEIGWSLVGIVGMVASALRLGLVVLLLVLLFTERRSGLSRSWMHYAGVVGFVILMLFAFVFRFLWNFLQS